MPDTDNWTLALQHAQKEDWLAAATLADRAFSDDAAPAPSEARSLAFACLVAAEWATRAGDSALTQKLARRALRDLEDSARADRPVAIEDFERGLRLLAPLINDGQGAELIDQHRHLLGRLFRSSFHQHTYADLDPENCYAGAMDDKAAMQALAGWSLKRGRPQWAVALLTEVMRGAPEHSSMHFQAGYLLQRAQRDLATLKRQLNLLAGPLALAGMHARETRWFAYPAPGDLLFATPDPADESTAYAVPTFKTAKPRSTVSLTWNFGSDGIHAFIDAGTAQRSGADRWNIREIPQGWFRWMKGSAVLSFLSSPVPWLIVWLMPLAWLWLVAFGPVGFGLNLDTQKALFSPIALAMCVVAWAFAGWFCRVIRFIRIEATDGHIAWIGVPVPIHRLASLDTETLDATATTEPADELLAGLNIRRIGDFIQIGSIHHRVSGIRRWGVEKDWEGVKVLGVLLLPILIVPLLWWAVGLGYGYLGGNDFFQNIGSIPIHVLVIAGAIVSFLVGLAAPLILFKALAVGEFRQSMHRVGYYDDQGKWVVVAQSPSARVAMHLLAGIQQQVSETTK